MAVIAILNRSKADDAEVAFAAAACDLQLRRDFVPIWGDYCHYQPVQFYSDAKDLPVASGIALLCTIVDQLDDPTAAAYHSVKGVPMIEIGYGSGELSVLLSHEITEESVDPLCMLTRMLPGGQRGALEVCDPVEGWAYPITVEVLGETRSVSVSAFVTPAWFNDSLSGPTFFAPGYARDLAPGELAEGGYLPVVGLDGVWTDLWGPDVSAEAMAAKAVKHAAVTARASRRRWVIVG
ncbi:MAG: hypothetical protein ABJA82_00520 [Myxococcales bacterium]